MRLWKIPLKFLTKIFLTKRCSEAVYPFNLPFHLPLNKIRRYLNKQQTNLPSVWQELAPDADAIEGEVLDFETLQLSSIRWELYSTEMTDGSQENLKKLNDYYGSPVEGDVTSDALIDQLKSVNIFLKKTDLNREQLNELLFQDLTLEEINDGALLSLQNTLNEDSSAQKHWTHLGKTALDAEEKTRTAIILKLTEKPSQEIRANIRNHGLKWNQLRQEWYGYVADIASLKECLKLVKFDIEVIK